MGLDPRRNGCFGRHSPARRWGQQQRDHDHPDNPGPLTGRSPLRYHLRRNAAVLAIAAFLLFPLATLAPGASPADDPSTPAILSAAESLFSTLKARDYTATWAVLTAKSRETIVSETEEAIRKAGGTPMPKEGIRDDFAAGGPLSRAYWAGFLRRFDPDSALEKSRWEMGGIEKDRAEVLILYHRADRPAVLRMYREDGEWKAGLVETFWGH